MPLNWSKSISAGLLMAILTLSGGAAFSAAPGEEALRAGGRTPVQKGDDAPEAQPDPASKLSTTLQVDFYSQYVFRGIAQSKGVGLQPSLSLSYRGFTASVWGNFDPEGRHPITGRRRGLKWTETDFSLSYSREILPRLILIAGSVYYAVEGPDSCEVYGALAYFFPWFAAGMAASREVSHYPGWHLEVFLLRKIALPWRKISLELWASWGFELSQDPEAFPDPGRPGRAYRGPLAGHLMATLNLPVSKTVTISPMIMYWYALGGESTQVIRQLSWDGRHNHLVGGVTIAASF